MDLSSQFRKKFFLGVREGVQGRMGEMRMKEMGKL
jgi:hypothetical protein